VKYVYTGIHNVSMHFYVLCVFVCVKELCNRYILLIQNWENDDNSRFFNTEIIVSHLLARFHRSLSARGKTKMFSHLSNLFGNKKSPKNILPPLKENGSSYTWPTRSNRYEEGYRSLRTGSPTDKRPRCHTTKKALGYDITCIEK